MDAGAGGFERGVALFEHGERGAAADQRVACRLRQFAIGVVDIGDAAVGVAQHDQIALRFEQAAGALLGFLQFPVPVRHRFIVHGDLAQFLAHQAQPDAQRGEREAGDREQKADADRKGVRIIARYFRAASADKSVGAAERGGEDHERANAEADPGMISAEAAEG